MTAQARPSTEGLFIEHTAGEIAQLAGAQPPIAPGESVQAYEQGLKSLLAELQAKTHMQVYLAQKIFDGIWWIRQYELAKHGVILNEMYNHLRDEQGLCESKQLQLRHCLFSGDWSHKLVQRALSKVGHTPQSLYARAVENCSENLLVFEQLIALRTKTLAQFQNTYETLVNRPVLQERLRMQNELIARDLRAIPLPPAGS